MPIPTALSNAMQYMLDADHMLCPPTAHNLSPHAGRLRPRGEILPHFLADMPHRLAHLVALGAALHHHRPAGIASVAHRRDEWHFACGVS